MAIDGILQAIRADAEAQIGELAETTAAEVAAIGARADEEAGQAELEAAESLDQLTERRATVILDRARLDARRAELRAIEAAYQSTLEDVRNRLAVVRGTPSYRDTMARLLDEALRVVSDPAVVIVHKGDTAMVRELLAERHVDCDATPSPSARAGGLDLEAPDGRLVHNSFESRLARADDELRAMVAGHLPDGAGE